MTLPFFKKLLQNLLLSQTLFTQASYNRIGRFEHQRDLRQHCPIPETSVITKHDDRIHIDPLLRDTQHFKHEPFLSKV